MLFLITVNVSALDRRKDQVKGDFSYYAYPISTTIPGLGTAVGFGFSVLNSFESNTDFTGFYLQGDFDASGYVMMDIHLIDERLVFDIGRYDYRVASKAYDRGIDSDSEDYIFVEAEGDNFIGQLTLTFEERMLEIYYRYGTGRNRFISLLDKEGEKFVSTNTDWNNAEQISYGGILDWTDDRLDPRKGIRLEAVRSTPQYENNTNSKFYVDERNLSAYIPFGISTLALNYYQSDAVVYDKATTDRDEIKASLGIVCNPASPEYTGCLAALEKNVDGIVAKNTHGSATSLGGTQRLRSYPGGRFSAGHSVFWGAESRWNLNDVNTPFDFYIAKGVHTGFQLAAFAEQGSVNDDPAKLFDDVKTSVGIGFRILLSGVVFRLDWATGDEGSQAQMFINYSWGLFSVDSSS